MIHLVGLGILKWVVWVGKLGLVEHGIGSLTNLICSTVCGTFYGTFCGVTNICQVSTKFLLFFNQVIR